MVPPPSVVVVVVVVLEVCPQANGATTASAMLSRVFFIVILPLVFPRAGRTLSPSLETGPTSLPINIFRIGTLDWLCQHFVSGNSARTARCTPSGENSWEPDLRCLTTGPPRGAAL